MEPIMWTDKISVGVKSFDEEHKQLINYINKLNHALQIGTAQKTMTEILTGLVNYTKIHFKHEEDSMVKHKYADYVTHKKEHDSLTSQVEDFYERLKSGKSTFSLELMNFLSNWLINHIQKTDMNYKSFFEGKM
ncbi:MAG: bacteriohemerythrin [Spirochaetota bacterium]